MDVNMEVVYERCCGIDVHKAEIVATVITGQHRMVTRNFGAFTEDLRDLAAWIKAEGCQMVAMESTGSYWKPLYNVFEIEGIKAMVVNSYHARTIPGYKTDKRDSRRLAKLLRHGLLQASFIPDKDQREFRELTRYRNSRIEERARELNRLQKMLEGANIKLGNVVSEITGDTATRLIKLAVSHESLTKEQIAEARDPKCKASVEEFQKALAGIVSPLQRELFAEVLRIIDEQTRQIERIEAMIQKYTTEAYDQAAKAIDPIPGIGRISAEAIIAEIGVDMSKFPTAGHLCAWAGVAPGDNESGGRRKSGKTRKGNRTLKKTLIQCATSAVNNKDSFACAQYQRLVVRKGRNKAIVAVAHSLLIAIYHVLSGNDFRDLGADYYTKFNKEKKIKSLIKQLQKLGVENPCPDLAV